MRQTPKMKWVFVFFALLPICTSGVTAHANPCVSDNGEGTSSGVSRGKGPATRSGGDVPSAQVGPYLTTMWGQSGHYSNSLSDSKDILDAENRNIGKKHAIGCTVLAVAQIFNCFKRLGIPNILKEADEDFGTLAKDIIKSGEVKIQAPPKDTPCDVGDLTHFFAKHRFTFNSGRGGKIFPNISKFNESVPPGLETNLVRALQNDNLILVSSSEAGWGGEKGGHSFVIDGYKQISKNQTKLKSNKREEYFQFHINFGWDGSHNGWYELFLLKKNYQEDDVGKWINEKAFLDFYFIFLPTTAASTSVSMSGGEGKKAAKKK